MHGVRPRKLFVIHVYLLLSSYAYIRYPDRHWSTVDELVLPETSPDSGQYVPNEDCNDGPYGPSGPVWTYGPSAGKRESFYCTHISSCQRLKNGNTLSKWGSEKTPE